MPQEIFNTVAASLLTPIPVLKPVTGWKELPIQECGEPMVPLGPFSAYPAIFQDSIYDGERSSSPYGKDELKGSLITPFVRRSIADKLNAAAELLPEGYALMVWDSYRTLEVQQSLYDDFYNQLIEKKGLTPEEAAVEAQRFVSMPSTDPSKPPPHHTGATVDLTIVKFPDDCLPQLRKLNEDLKSDDWKTVYMAEMGRLKLLRERAQPIRMGTMFDEVSPGTGTRYYEQKLAEGALTPEETECLQNRRLLYNVMVRAGFSNYSEEWWHFDCGNQFDAIRSGRQAIYGAGPLTQECKEWEDMRRWHGMPQLKTGPSETELKVFESAFCNKNRDLRTTIHPKASRLQVT